MPNTLQIGDIVRKGNGKVLYRVWAISHDGQRASVVKLDTKQTPKRGCFYRFKEFTLVTRP
jgi:hypothetical protein